MVGVGLIFKGNFPKFLNKMNKYLTEQSAVTNKSAVYLCYFLLMISPFLLGSTTVLAYLIAFIGRLKPSNHFTILSDHYRYIKRICWLSIGGLFITALVASFIPFAVAPMSVIVIFYLFFVTTKGVAFLKANKLIYSTSKTTTT